jgi:hypothetical protein
MLGMSTLYFSHGYAPDDRRFNEHIWKLLRAQQFEAWIDTGLQGGWSGARRPMDVSFNEWMLSRCAGFIAICPRRDSEYQVLEYRLALRIGLPTLVFVQNGGRFSTICNDSHEFPTSWGQFWKRQTQARIENAIKTFREAVTRHEQSAIECPRVGHWRPRLGGVNLKIALLQPRADDREWVDVQDMLQQETNSAYTLFNPRNFSHPQELVRTTAEQFDLLVLDVGHHGTPKEMLGYIEAQGIPLVRTCKFDKQADVAAFGKYVAGKRLGGKQRSPYEHMHNDTSLPRFLDGLKLDDGMEPVFYWRRARQLADRLKELADRISIFRSGLTPDEGGSRIELENPRETRHYFQKRYEQAERASVFLSFAGKGGATDLADRLAAIVRFLDCRCFHYRDPDSTTEGRLESGELVNEGLKLRVDQADIVVILMDHAYLGSSYCKDEAARAEKLYNRGELEIRAYATEPLRFDELKNINVFPHRGSWSDEPLEQLIISDIEASIQLIRSPIRESEKRTIESWLAQDGRTNGRDVKSVLEREGVPAQELAEIDWSQPDWIDAFFSMPGDADKHQRARERIALFLMAISETHPDRREQVILWVRRRRLVGLVAKPIARAEDVVTVDSNLSMAALGDDPKIVGQVLGKRLADVLNSDRPLVLRATAAALQAPIEWTRENKDSEPVALRRPIRWYFPGIVTRSSLFDQLSDGGLPPRVLLLTVNSLDINPEAEARVLESQLKDQYRRRRWPIEFIRVADCDSIRSLKSGLTNCREQIVQILGHLGAEGVRAGSEVLSAAELASALASSDVRLLVLSGCEGGAPISPTVFANATLIERIVQDGEVPEVVAHRKLLSDEDGQSFSRAFYNSFLEDFDTSRAVFKARKEGSVRLSLSPVLVSQRSESSS